MKKTQPQPARPTVYDGGFAGFKVDAGEYPDLVGHLYTEFLKDLEAKPGAAPARKARAFALAFVEFARAYLDANPPRTQRYVGQGVGVELQNGVTVTFGTQDATVVAHRDESVAVARPRSQPGQHGVSDTHSVPITTGRTKVDHAPRTQADPPGQKQPGKPGRRR